MPVLTTNETETAMQLLDKKLAKVNELKRTRGLGVYHAHCPACETVMVVEIGPNGTRTICDNRECGELWI